jgi:hypothetical protein
MRHLIAACRALGGGGRLFLFADQEALGRGNILTHEWANGRSEWVPLLTADGSLIHAHLAIAS